MEEVINFIQTNYVWFIIGIIVLVMTIVGYFAEKTGFSFGNKQKTQNNDKNLEVDEEVNDLSVSSKEEGIADMIRENNEEHSIPTYTEDDSNIGQPSEEISMQDTSVPEEKINLEASDEDLYKPLSNPVEEVTNDIPDELYAPIENTENTENDKITLEDVTPFSIEPEDSIEQVEDETSEYSRLFPSDPILIDGEKKEEPEEEVNQEDVWNV